MLIFRNIFLVWLSFALIVSAQELPEKQRGVAERYGQLEQILLRMSEASATSNPRRAELLKKVLLASKDKLVALRLESVVDILQRRQLTEAIAGQEGVEKDLLELLKLLESENRDQRRQLEKEKIKEFLRDLEEIIHQEKALKSRTAQEEDEKLKNLEKNQRDVRLRAQSLRDRIDEHENPDAKPEESDKSDSEKDSKTETPEGEKPTEKKTASETEKEKTEQEKSQPEKSEQTKEKSDEKTDEKTDEKEDANDSPTQKAMKKAMQRMKQAEKKLQKAEKSPALEDQEEAIAELQRAKAELEKILRQLREEELLQTLEKLEARFKRMLKVEQSIRTQTEKLAQTEAPDERSNRIQASRIAADQQSVLDDADAALVLLRDDGTAQAMVESLLQARFDMEEIKVRLDKTQLDSVTLDIEDAVIAALQEMLEAIDMAIKEAEKRKENPPPPDSPEGGEQETEPLIQILSELKMIRSMQKRVNERTQRCDKAIEEMRDDPNADLEVLRKKVEELARQQNRISRILHDLKVGKTR